MKFHVITVFPQMILEALQWGVVGKAMQKGLFSVSTINPRDFTTDVHKTIDDRPFGGGDGMVMLFEPLAQAIESVENHRQMKKYYMSPAGALLTENKVRDIGSNEQVMILSGRYGGVDQRLLQHYGFEPISVGDYVVSGGELPALTIIDAVARKIPGVLGNEQSAAADSFADQQFLEAPMFTRPREHMSGNVPEVLVGGDHKKIAEYRRAVGLGLTLQNRPELVNREALSGDIQAAAKILKSLSSAELELLGFRAQFLETL